jgi:hypothetical protein
MKRGEGALAPIIAVAMRAHNLVRRDVYLKVHERR